MRESAAEGERIEREADKFLRVVSKRASREREGEADEVERYLSRDNLADCKKASPWLFRCRWSRGKNYAPAWTKSWRRYAN